LECWEAVPGTVDLGFFSHPVIKGPVNEGRNGAFFRKALVVFQFGVSVLLIISVTCVLSQMHYVKNADLGFEKEQSLIVRLDNGSISEKR
jgi:putative ABC transport system permease protein